MFIGTFFAPVAVIIAFNIIIFCIGLRVLIKSTRQQAIQGNNARATVKLVVGICVIMTLFGVGWVFGALTVSKPSKAFQYLFVIFNAFQGFYFFIFICIFGKDGRDFWINLFRIKLLKKSIIKPTLPNKHKSQTCNSLQSESYTSVTSRNTFLSSKGSSSGFFFHNPQKVTIEFVPGKNTTDSKESDECVRKADEQDTATSVEHQKELAIITEEETCFNETKEANVQDDRII